MKTSKIPGCGRFGIYIDDLDLNKVTHDAWMEIGQLHLETLITIFRNVNISVERFEELVKKWGLPRSVDGYNVNKNGITEKDVEHFENCKHVGIKNSLIVRVTGKRNKDGKIQGIFANGELKWHSNESGQLAFTPGVALLCGSDFTDTSTGFVTSTDWYEKQTEAFRSELDEMIVEHKFDYEKLNPGFDKDEETIMRRNFGEDGELPLVIQSPGGIKGLHLGMSTFYKIKDMSLDKSNTLFEKICNEMFVDEYTYDHVYGTEKDLCIFDNSITLHRRSKSKIEREMLRLQFDYNKLQSDYNFYFHEPYKTDFKILHDDINRVCN